MIILKPLDYFDTKLYNKCGDNMKNFINCDLKIKDITLACLVPPNGGTPVHKNRATFGLAFYTKGSGIFKFDKKDFAVKHGEIIFMPQGSNYIVDTKAESTSCFAINFTMYNNESFSPFVFKPKNHSTFSESFRQAEYYFRTKTKGFDAKVKSELYNIIFNMQKEYNLGYTYSKYADIIQPAVNYIHKEYTGELISVPYLAKLCGISEPYFRRVFLKVHGTSPLKYINNLKITRAKELLDSNMYAVNQVSIMSGYNDDAYFSREFKKSTGFSPVEYSSIKKIHPKI